MIYVLVIEKFLILGWQGISGFPLQFTLKLWFFFKRYTFFSSESDKKASVKEKIGNLKNANVRSEEPKQVRIPLENRFIFLVRHIIESVQETCVLYSIVWIDRLYFSTKKCEKLATSWIRTQNFIKVEVDNLDYKQQSLCYGEFVPS